MSVAVAPEYLPPADAIERALWEASLAEFIAAAWHVVEPTTPYKSNWHIDAVCEHLEAITAGQIRRLVINIPPRTMKPESMDTLVTMGDGGRRRLGDLAIGDSVISHAGVPRRVAATQDVGVRDCVRILTHSGRETVAALDHPMLTPHGWTHAGELAVGQSLAVVHWAQTTGGADPWASRLAGYFVGDGNVTGNAATISCFGDEEQVADMRACAEHMGFGFRTLTGEGRYSLVGGVRPWLRSIGLQGKTSYTKRVPDFVMRGGREAAAHFLAAYFVCDGTLNHKGGGRRALCMSITSVSFDLLDDVRELLARLGIPARIRRRVTTENSFVPGTHFGVLTLNGVDATAKFMERVPIIGVKAKRLAEWAPQRTAFDQQHHADRIVEITPTTAECRCIVVEGDHSYVGDGFAVHNSLSVGVFWPAWVWTRQPSFRWLFAAYAQTLSTRDSLKCRRVIQSPWYQANWGDKVTLTTDQNVKTRFENDATGYRIATAVDGVATGEGGDVVVVDDPHNVKKAISDQVRKATNREWWDQAMSTRLNDKQTGAFVIMMQRLHEDDLTGHVLAQDRGYEHLMLPARFEPKRKCMVESTGFEDPRTEEGELLWPGHMREEDLQEIEADLGPYGTAGQMQQRPAPRTGGQFERDWFEIVKAPPVHTHMRVRSWDLAGTKDAGAATVGMRMSMVYGKESVLYVEHVVRGQWRAGKRDKLALGRAHEDVQEFEGNKMAVVHIVEQEPGSGGKAQAENFGSMLIEQGMPCEWQPSSGDKFIMADPVAGAAQLGRVKLVEGPWNEVLLAELERAGPGAAFLDQMDTLAKGYNWLMARKPPDLDVDLGMAFEGTGRASPWRVR